MARYIDLYEIPEDERIKIIGEKAERGERVGFIVEDNIKADRYINKLISRYPVEVVERGDGPIANNVFVIVTRHCNS